MNTIHIEKQNIIIKITGWDKIFCLKGQVSFAKRN